MAAHEAIAQAPGGGGGTPAPGVTHDSALGRWSIALPGRPAFYTTQREIREARIVVPSAASARTIVVLWNERDSTGHDFPARAITLDGGATVPVAGPTRYDIPLRFASFTPEWTGVSRPGALPGARPGVIGAGEATVPPGLRAPPTNDVYIVQFVTQPLQEYRDAIAAVGGTIHHWLAYHSYVVQMSPQARAQVAAMPFVRWVGPLHVAYRIDPRLITPAIAAGMPSNEPATAKRYNILVNRRGLQDKAAVAGVVEVLGGHVDFGVHQYGFLMGATLTESQLLAAARLNEWSFADEWQAGGMTTDIARELNGANYVASPSVGGFTGNGVRGEVMDWNFLETHQAFRPGTSHQPLIHSGSSGADYPPGPLNPYAGDNYKNHGTSCYGVIFGSDTNVSPAYKGLAPDAQGIFATAIRLEERNLGGTVSREQHIAELVDPSGPYRACFQSNSWHWGLSTDYTATCAELDDILLRYELSVFQAQGNNGVYADPTYGVATALCKNVVSVGGIMHGNTAARSDDQAGPYWCTCENEQVQAYIHCQTARCDVCPNPCQYCPTPCQAECPREVGSASIGPALDGRVKPDLVDLYEAINAPGNSFCNSLSTSSYTPIFSGTSAATPQAAGCAPLIYQMWHAGFFPGHGGGNGDVFDDRARFSTIKALLINSAYQYAFSTSTGMDRDHQGWGMPDLAVLAKSAGEMLIIDETVTLKPFDSTTFYVTSSGVNPLKATLVYRDPKGTALSSVHRVNDLNLVLVSPDGHKYYGNDGLQDGRWSTPDNGVIDDRNTVENIFVQFPTQGSWELVVSAAEVNVDSHLSTGETDADFSLVVSGVTGGSPVIMPDWNHDGVTNTEDLQAFMGQFARNRAVGDRSVRAAPSDAPAFVAAWLQEVTKVAQR